MKKLNYKEIKHGHIVQLIDTFESEDNKLYMIMKYASGGDMFDHLEKCGKLNEMDAREIFSQLIETFEYMHEKRIVYR